MTQEYRINVIDPGPRPPFYMVAEHLWGSGCNIDSDGNSLDALDCHWTELTIVLREAECTRVDIDPVFTEPLVLQVCALSLELAEKAAKFIVKQSGGEIQHVV